jgi:hypothetical protein
MERLIDSPIIIEDPQNYHSTVQHIKNWQDDQLITPNSQSKPIVLMGPNGYDTHCSKLESVIKKV